jgi:hypothetical protein
MIAERFTTELIWDEGHIGTGQPPRGALLCVGGPPADWSAEDLLLLAVQTSAMTAFLELVHRHRLDVLGYVSRGSVSLETDTGSAALLLTSCIVVRSVEHAQEARQAFTDALAGSLVVRALARPPDVELEVQIADVGRATGDR